MSTQTALIIVDVQSSIVEYCYQGNEVVERIQTLLEKARHANIPALFVQHNEPEGSPLATGTPGWQIHPTLCPHPDEPIIQKTACDSFFETSLQDELKARSIDHLVIVGFQTEYCIDTTCRTAVSHGYEVTLAGDCHSTTDDAVLKAADIIAHHNANLNGLGTPKNIITVKESREIFE
ncbi:cysteine hydrolase family protein [Brevibacillus borstelensis]|jgi:nicotinamidase-related amidase|uniref:cysteine hydrolase family protein n=1 Tax=Brevibacillus borstelensis TaxID=45462 RepID=UPI00046813C9|nr:cysteine hydrolase family protein [Brevibacillus borstelensis]KKX52522.1 isochorismatase [Brevibacillus borstelensis cifa_chp40]MCC0566771.1 cysteine hydrolase [Brevibacillus borstelensis]MCM3561444.1 cysteine hydrolase [Brevibacillus borstelensis]MCM3593867.1 cysteine hydrolase [Brevibacillus borstelensis]MED1851307.1 cysteine hydrolase family protein [Brevibacillus borstelensis]